MPRSLVAPIALALSFLGCAPDFTAHGDVTFTAEERAKIEEGNRWLADALHEEPIDIVWDLEHPSDDVQWPRARIIRRGVPFCGAADIGCAFVLNVSLDPAALTTSLAAHEFGHYRGMRHVTEPGIMNHTIGPLIWTHADQCECQRAGVCHVITACGPT
jgi:hypothetical protein